MERLHASSDSRRHSLLAKSVVLAYEHKETFALLHQQFIDRIDPTDGIEISLVEDLSATVWRQRRLWHIETDLLNETARKRAAPGHRVTGAFSDLSRGPELALLDRQESRLHRSFHRTLKNIQLLRQIELPNEPRSEELDLESAIYPTTSEPENTSSAHASCAVFTPGEHPVPPQQRELPNEPNSPQLAAKLAPYPQTSQAPLHQQRTSGFTQPLKFSRFRTDIYPVISLKKHIDDNPDLARRLANAYQSSLAATCRAASRTAPQLTPALQGNLDALGGRLSLKAVAEIDSKVVTELDAWGERSSSYFREKATEVREILLLVSQSAQAAGEKDERYVSQLSAFSGRLNDIASLEDISRIRQSLSKSAADLKTCVDRMAEDGKATVSKLQAQLETYQQRLRDAEMQAVRDPLTRLDNRLGIERRMEERVAAGQPFTLILIDLNGFKQVNDMHGHLAGDELLKQFAAELRGRFRPIDGPGRWGGDEFLVIFDGNVEQAAAAVSKASEWLFGEYRLKSAKVQVTASIGIAQWNGSESVLDTLKRADADMYRQKGKILAN